MIFDCSSSRVSIRIQDCSAAVVLTTATAAVVVAKSSFGSSRTGVKPKFLAEQTLILCRQLYGFDILGLLGKAVHLGINFLTCGILYVLMVNEERFVGAKVDASMGSASGSVITIILFLT